jgi:16S rRNA A1518/A1519 N6-dimethyltransferase RsmA/KsgA/DIM1 with predicted DNA glycosylase/AP lyase activity
LIAKPGSKQYSRISAYAQLLSVPTKRARLPRHLFDPQPGVDSSVIHFVPTGVFDETTAANVNVVCGAADEAAKGCRDGSVGKSKFSPHDWDRFLCLVFARPNKTLRAQLVGRFKRVASEESLAALEALLKEDGLAKERTKKLSAEELYALMQRLEEAGLLEQLLPDGTTEGKDRTRKFRQ